MSVEPEHSFQAMKSSVTKVDLPTRSAILSRLASLVSGELSPDDASNWAATWLIADHTPGTDVQIGDWPAWEAIKLLAGADLQVEPGCYLYGTEDFEVWLEDLKAAPVPPERPTIR